MKKSPTAKIKKLFAILLSGLMLFYFEPVKAAGSIDKSNKKIDELNKQKEDLKSDKSDANEILSDLKGQQSDLKNNVNSISGQLSSVQKEVESARQAVVSASNDIQKLTEELEQAKKDEEDQYKAMMLQIQYIYENQSAVSPLSLLLSSRSISDFISRSQYASSIIEYDNKLIKSYKETQETIKKKQALLEGKKSDFKEKQNNLTAKQTELNSQLNEAKSNLDSKNDEVKAQEGEIIDINSRIEGIDSEVTRIQKEVQDAQAALAMQIANQLEEEAKNNGGTPKKIDTTQGEKYNGGSEEALLAALIQAEAGNQGYDGMLAVASVVMNRVLSPQFRNANTITDVIYQKNQFEPTRRKVAIWENGEKKYLDMTYLEYYLANPDKVSDNARKAASQAIQGVRYEGPDGPMNQLFFMTPAAFEQMKQTKWLQTRTVADQFTLKGHTFFNVY